MPSMFPTAQLTISHSGRQFAFTAFDTPFGMQALKEIIEGTAYPAIDFTGEVRTVIDIGANIGAAALCFSLRYPAANILCFEPFPDAVALLRQNTESLPHVRVFDFGLFDRDGQLPLFLSRHDPVTNSLGKSSHNSDQTLHVRLREAAAVLRENQIRSIDILKIDTEGAEIPILQSLAPFLPDTRAIYIEYHSEADRLAIDQLLRHTHILARAHTLQPHKGELTYIQSTGIAAQLDPLKISPAW